jgi:hypothetical protein
MEALPGDPVPGYEQRRDSYGEKDVDAFWEAALARERENKKNAAEFVGDYASAMVELWAKEVSAAMAEAGKKAGWSFFDKVLKFVAIKTLEIAGAAVLTPAGAELFAALGKELSEHVIEKGTEALLAYGGEHVAEALEEKKKDSDIEVAQEDLDRVTDAFATDVKKISVDTFTSLPDIAPYTRWLGVVQGSKAYWELEKFRLPARFPVFDRDYVRAIVAGLVVSALHLMEYSEREPVEGEPEETVRGGDENVIYVGGRDLDYAKIESPSRRLTWALAYALPIRELPTVPLIVNVSEHARNDPEAAERLMAAFRGLPAALPGEAAEFLEAYDATYASMLVTRNALGEVSVSGGRLGEHLYLYALSTFDTSLTRMVSEILTWAEGERQYTRELDALRNDGGGANEASSELIPARELAHKAFAYLTERQMQEAGARAVVANVQQLVPHDPDEGATHSAGEKGAMVIPPWMRRSTHPPTVH